MVIRAAGGLVWRADHDGVRVALVHRPRYDDWSLPKGKLDPGEHPLLAAHREVVEETGVHPVVGPRLPSVTYRVAVPGGSDDKLVDFWSMAAGPTEEFTPNAEIDAVRWVPLASVPDELTDADYRPVVAAFAALPRISATVLLVRHASAGDRHAWPGPDEARPLDDKGRAQADRLARLLPLFAPERAITSTMLRCRQSIEPTVRRLGLTAVPERVFDETAHAVHPERAARRVRLLAAERGRTVVCSQGGLIPDTVAMLADSDGLDLPDVRTPKASGWVLSFAGGRLVAADPFSAKQR